MNADWSELQGSVVGGQVDLVHSNSLRSIPRIIMRDSLLFSGRNRATLSAFSFGSALLCAAATTGQPNDTVCIIQRAFLPREAAVFHYYFFYNSFLWLRHTKEPTTNYCNKNENTTVHNCMQIRPILL